MASPARAVDRPVRAPRSKFWIRRAWSAALALAALAIVWFAPLGLDPQASHAIAVAAFMIVSWVDGAIPPGITGFVGCCLFWMLGAAGFRTAFSGFADLTPWFLLGTLLLGAAVAKSGLANRMAGRLVRFSGTTYSRLLLGLILASFLLTFLIPSGIACIAIMAPIAQGVVKNLGLARGSNVGRGLFIALTYTAGMFDKMVVAGAASILGRGLIEKATHTHIYWSLWALAFLPCAIVTILVTWRLILLIYPPDRHANGLKSAISSGALREPGPWSPLEKKVLVLTLSALALWATDLVHQISPAYIGMGAGILAVLPKVGILNRADLKRLNYLPVIFVAAAMSMSIVLIQTDALSPVAARLFDWMAPHMTNRLAFAAVPYWSAFLLHILLGNETGMLAASLPALLQFAQLRGLAAVPLGMVWSFAAGGKIFAYQSGVMVAGYSYGYFEARDLLRVGFLLSVLESLLLLVVVPFYWPWIGLR